MRWPMSKTGSRTRSTCGVAPAVAALRARKATPGLDAMDVRRSGVGSALRARMRARSSTE